MGRWTGRLPTWALWLVFLAIAIFGILVPYGHLAFAAVLGPRYRWIQLAAIVAMGLWFLGRPLLVVVANRNRPRTPQPPAHGVSVVIPCSNSASSIQTTVDSLLAQTHRPIEIVLIENNSNDDTWDVVQELARRHPEVVADTVGSHPGVYAASVAINHGVRVARYEIILRLDDDTTIRSDAVARAVAEMYAQDAVAVACDLRTANPDASLWTRLQSIEYLFAMDIDRRTQAVFGSILCCSGGMALFRKDVILAAGGFVSEPREVSEDMDMTLKCHRLGHVAIAPEAFGFTQVPETLHALLKQRFRWGISGTVALYLHRRGLLNRSYWHTGSIGFIGLPLRAATALRDLLAPLYILDLALLLSHDGPKWLPIVLGARMVIMWAQMLCLRPALNRPSSLQGLGAWWLTPLFVLVYGPLLLGARFAGSWTGVAHVRELRRRDDRVTSGGIDSSPTVADDILRLPERAIPDLAASEALG